MIISLLLLDHQISFYIDTYFVMKLFTSPKAIQPLFKIWSISRSITLTMILILLLMAKLLCLTKISFLKPVFHKILTIHKIQILQKQVLIAHPQQFKRIGLIKLIQRNYCQVVKLKQTLSFSNNSNNRYNSKKHRKKSY